MSLSMPKLLQVSDKIVSRKARLSTSQDRPKKQLVRKDAYGKTIKKGGKHQVSFNPKIRSFIGLASRYSQPSPQIQQDYYSESEESDDDNVSEIESIDQVKKQTKPEQKETVVKPQEIQIDLIIPKDEMVNQDKKSQNKTIMIEQSACCWIF